MKRDELTEFKKIQQSHNLMAQAFWLNYYFNQKYKLSNRVYS